MTTAVNLRTLVDEMGFQNDESQAYLDRETGEIYLIPDDTMAAAEEGASLEHPEDWEREGIENAREILEDREKRRYIALPSSFDIHEWAIMERFCRTVSEEASGRLLDAIHGRGAFRMFKSAVQQLGIEQDWFRFRDEALADLARRWCEEKDIPYTEGV